MKVVINTCYGGFALSQKALNRLSELGSKYVSIFEEEDFNEVYYNDVFDTYSHEFRTDEKVLQAVSELGEESWGTYSELKVIDIPDDVIWQIDEYGGMEEIREVSRRWS